jgi:hypothetical protein
MPQVLLFYIQLEGCWGPWGTLTLTLQCENMLNSWHSDMGKAGCAAILDIWKANQITFSSVKADEIGVH